MLLDRYGVNTVIVPERSFMSGELYALVGLLTESPAWDLRYSDKTALIFVRIAGNP